MCGRFTLTAEPEAIQQTFNLDAVPDITPRYNIAPTQPVGVITNDAPRKLDFYSWGLIPGWAKDPTIGGKMFNARSETAHEKPSFKNAFKRRRCLIPASGLYEWPQKGQPPVYIHLKDSEVFAFAGLWEIWNSPDGDEIRSCTILTTEPNPFMKQFHHRMAVILPPEHYATWLTPGEMPPAQLMPLLRGEDAAKMTAYEVSKAVNNVRNDSPENIAPLNTPQQPTLL